MPRKGENIYRRKDNRWEARYVKGYSCNGKILYQRTAETHSPTDHCLQ